MQLKFKSNLFDFGREILQLEFQTLFDGNFKSTFSIVAIQTLTISILAIQTFTFPGSSKHLV